MLFRANAAPAIRVIKYASKGINPALGHKVKMSPVYRRTQNITQDTNTKYLRRLYIHCTTVNNVRRRYCDIIKSNVVQKEKKPRNFSFNLLYGPRAETIAESFQWHLKKKKTKNKTKYI